LLVESDDEDGEIIMKKQMLRFAKVALGALMCLAAIPPLSLAQGRRAECTRYAREAVDQYEENQRMRCNFAGSRWSSARETHFAWCLLYERKARWERHIRRKLLQECAERAPSPTPTRTEPEPDDLPAQSTSHSEEGKHASCDTYSRVAAIQVDANKKNECGFEGPEWTQDEQAHYEWCVRNKRVFAMDEIRFRAQELQKCFDKLGDYDDKDWDRNYRRRFN
jgi:hypothetical protein